MSQVLEPTTAIDPDELRDALAESNVPCLIGVLYQLTGDARWLDEPYRIARTVGFEDLDDGGLPPERVAEVREAAFTAIMNWSNGTPIARPVPAGDELIKLMSAVIGEPVPDQVVPVAGDQLGITPFVPADVADRCAQTGFSAIVVGAGFSGLAAAAFLKQAGIPFKVFERNNHIGGTWWEARYPGARVDIPNDLYSYSFFHHNWSENFSQPDEIVRYVDDFVDHFGLDPHIETGVTVERAEWDDAANQWVLTVTRNGATEQVRTNALIGAPGLHSTPNIPQVPGLDDFKGVIAHTARWDRGIDLRGKKVAVVGAGASAMQVVCKVADEVEQLIVVQPEPHWALPNEQYFRLQPASRHWLYDHVPFYRAWFRFRLYWNYTERSYPALEVDPNAAAKGRQVNGLNDAYRRLMIDYIRAELGDRTDLIEKVTPNYPPFGKRLLMDNGWYRTLRKPNVTLVQGRLARLTEHTIVASSGEEFEADVVVLCTGFQQQRLLYSLDVRGRNGAQLRQEWNDDNARAYLGLTVPGYPNLFILYGPNTNPPGGSWLVIGEAQARYIVSLLTRMLQDDIAAVDCRPEPFEAYNREIDDRNAKMVYAMEGVHNYYRNSSGRVVTNSPLAVPEYVARTYEPNLDDYVLTKRAN